MSSWRNAAVVAALSSLLAVSNAQTSRTITFNNKCGQDVWFGPTTGADGQCSSSVPCPSGTTCAANGFCYYNNPTPSTGTYRVKAGGSNTVTFPHPADNGNFVWNGNYAFCMNGQTCSKTAANCDATGCIAQGPSALAEFTLSNEGTDFYDISIIGGVNVPITISANTLDSTNTASTAPYSCGNPGNNAPATTNLGKASWAFTPPSVQYQWVTPPSTSTTSCTSSSQCPSGQTCGTVVNNDIFSQVCGYLSGYWAARGACQLNGGTSFFNCGSTITNGPYTGTIGDFQGCGVTSGSCYQPGADANCCGCVNWTSYLGSSAVPSVTSSCYNNDTQWSNTILPTIAWLKKGCPNCYTYPYDDESSTFTCNKMNGKYNAQNYTITMCPNGVSWPGTLTSGSTTTSTVKTTTTTTKASTTTTAGSSTSTGKCNGVSYSSSQVCDNGHVCPSGQYYCGSACYNPSTSCCSAGAIVASSSTGCKCGSSNQVYSPTSYVCDANQICPLGTYNCGGACYNPSSYSCCNSALTPAGQGC